jgi:DNA-3-methyladenine glycosylase
VPTIELARRLLGMRLVTRDEAGYCAGLIVETEAYGGTGDRASHARAGLTRRTAPMFGPPGHAYVYLVYGMHECLNVVAEPDGRAGAVLIRALEPVAGLDLMRRRRNRPTDPDGRLCAGPARLAQALGVTRALDGHDLTLGRRLWLDQEGERRVADGDIAAGPRVGVGYAGAEWATVPWRFWITGHPSVSR